MSGPDLSPTFNKGLVSDDPARLQHLDLDQGRNRVLLATADILVEYPDYSLTVLTDLCRSSHRRLDHLIALHRSLGQASSD